MIVNKDLYTFQYYSFKTFVRISLFLIIISAVGLSKIAPKYLSYLDYFIRIYVCLFLLWRFHPFKKKYEFTELDREISFYAGVFILTTTVINTYITNVKNYASNLVNKEKRKFITPSL